MIESKLMTRLVVLVALGMLALRVVAAQQPSGTPLAARRLAIATHAIGRGAVLGAGDFEYRDTTLRTLNGDGAAVATGWITRRAIASGEVLRAPAVEAPTVVAANSPVELEYENENVRLTLRGTATGRGAVGDQVNVRTELGRRVHGTIVAPGRVRIN